MANCFWLLCDCPIEEPCPEHFGTGCSQIGGKAIAKESDVDDAITHTVETAIATLEGDVTRADEIHRRLEAHKTQLEKERADLEQQAQAASSRAQRQAVVDEERSIAKRHDQLSAEITALVNELDALGSSYITAATRVSLAVIIPFSDPNGYCACYNAKLADLSRLAGQITAEQATLAAATLALNAAKVAVFPKLKFTFSIAGAVFLFIFLVFGGLYGLVVAAFIALMFTAVTVVGLAIQLYFRKKAVLQSRIALLRLWLSYYRIQQIPTCLKSPDFDDECDDEEDDGKLATDYAD